MLQKKESKRLVSLLLSSLMIISIMLVPAYAEENDSQGNLNETVIEGDATGPVYAYGGETVIVEGQVSGAVWAYDEGTTIEVENGVSNNTSVRAVSADNGAVINITGDVTSVATNEGNDELAYATAVAAGNGATVTVDGNVTAKNSDGTNGIAIETWQYNSSQTEDETAAGVVVKVTGNVSGDVGALDGAEIEVGGNIEGNVTAVSEADIAVGGDITGYTFVNGNSEIDVTGNINGALEAQEGSVVTVKGSLNSETGTLITGIAEQTTLEVGKDVNGNLSVGSYSIFETNQETGQEELVQGTSDCSTAKITGNMNGNLDVMSGSNVEVSGNMQGNVTIGRSSVYYSDPETGEMKEYMIPEDHSSVIIEGNLTGTVWADNETETKIGGDVAGHLWSYGTSNIEVSGSVIGSFVETPEGDKMIMQTVSAHDDSSIEIIGDAKAGIAAYNNSSITVDGEVEGNIERAAGNSRVYVEKSVSGYIEAIGLDKENVEGAEAVVKGDVGGFVMASNGISVEVGGDVGGWVNASEGGNVTVSGNVGGVTEASDGGSVKIDGDVNSDSVGIRGIVGAGHETSLITVEGVVNSKNASIELVATPTVKLDIDPPKYPNPNDFDNDQDYQEAIDEFIQKSDEYNALVVEAYKKAEAEMNNQENVAAIVSALPQIIVQTLQPEGDFILVSGGLNEENSNQVTESLINQINYIVNTEGVDSANIAVFGYENLDGYHVAQETKRLTVKSTKDGFIIANVKAGQYATIEDNGDGSYSILVERGGDLNISASIVARPVPKQPDTGSAAGGSGNSSAGGDTAVSVSNDSVVTIDGDRQLVIPVYEKHELIVDMTATNYAGILVSTFRNFQQNGFDTVIFRTYAGDYAMSMDDLIALAGNGILYTFYVHDSMIDIYVDYQLVTTLSMMKRT